MNIKNLITVILSSLFLSACSGYHYKNYQPQIIPNEVDILDLSDNTPGSATIYFDSITYRDVGIPFHRLLLATKVDGVQLKDAGRFSLLDISGYQAIKVSAGSHSLEWCWVSMNSLGTGGAKCDFRLVNFEFEENKRYLITWLSKNSIKGTPKNKTMEISINSIVKDFDSGAVLFPK